VLLEGLTCKPAVLPQEQAAQAADAAQLQEQLQQWRARAAQLQLQLVAVEGSFAQQLEQVGHWARPLLPRLPSLP
jgi:hypothetical protein